MTKTYVVTFRRREVSYCNVEIEADNEQQAKRRARKKLEDDFNFDPDWCDSSMSRAAVERIEEVP